MAGSRAAVVASRAASAGSPRLTDVAQAAGVSVATASRALTGRGSVASDTRERVRRAAATLDFHPSAAGQNLRARSTRMIGFIVPDISSGFYANALKGADRKSTRLNSSHSS